MKDWVPSMLLLALFTVINLTAAIITAEREHQDRELIALLTHNQELTTDVLKLRGGDRR